MPFAVICSDVPRCLSVYRSSLPEASFFLHNFLYFSSARLCSFSSHFWLNQFRLSVPFFLLCPDCSPWSYATSPVFWRHPPPRIVPRLSCLDSCVGDKQRPPLLSQISSRQRRSRRLGGLHLKRPSDAAEAARWQLVADCQRSRCFWLYTPSHRSPVHGCDRKGYDCIDRKISSKGIENGGRPIRPLEGGTTVEASITCSIICTSLVAPQIFRVTLIRVEFYGWYGDCHEHRSSCSHSFPIQNPPFTSLWVTWVY